MTRLVFPDDQIVGTIEWIGSWSIETGPVMATGMVEVPDDVALHLSVQSLTPMHRSGTGWAGSGDGRPVNLSFLRALPSTASITALDIASRVVAESFAAVTALADRLERLCLRVTDLPDDVLVHVAALSRLTSLQTWGNRFTDAGVQILGALQRLESLSLEEESLTPAAFAFVDDLPGLRSLSVQDVAISDAELVSLQERLPGVQVSR